MAETAVLVRYFAAAAEAAGRREESVCGVTTAGELRRELSRRHGAAMERVLANGSLLLDGVVSRDDGRALGATADVLPPFAGG
ncbi:MoaD/ThiS family protein [Schumannella soli]|uniref:MoaD/ThiS family protein n=1 Tax=Schumannella soli TaxID=2590779 RepID=A0A506Y245_9MICO|nr:MoaD/ThiS family protein [Schumannella soli]TPW75517.1 MoaD/ThiS family protein [Schumannella soli]